MSLMRLDAFAKAAPCAPCGVQRRRATRAGRVLVGGEGRIGPSIPPWSSDDRHEYRRRRGRRRREEVAALETAGPTTSAARGGRSFGMRVVDEERQRRRHRPRQGLGSEGSRAPPWAWGRTPVFGPNEFFVRADLHEIVTGLVDALDLVRRGRERICDALPLRIGAQEGEAHLLVLLVGVAGFGPDRGHRPALINTLHVLRAALPLGCARCARGGQGGALLHFFSLGRGALPRQPLFLWGYVATAWVPPPPPLTARFRQGSKAVT